MSNAADYHGLLNQAQLKLLLRYDSATGEFYWAANVCGRNQKGARAAKPMAGRYSEVQIYGCRFFASHLAWLYVYGAWPKNLIDHINRNKSDDRIANLREATHSQNQANTKLSQRNKTGYKGVSFSKRDKKYYAGIKLHRKTKYLGIFPTAEEASRAVEAARLKYFGEFAEDRT